MTIKRYYYSLLGAFLTALVCVRSAHGAFSMTYDATMQINESSTDTYGLDGAVLSIYAEVLDTVYVDYGTYELPCIAVLGVNTTITFSGSSTPELNNTFPFIYNSDNFTISPKYASFFLFATQGSSFASCTIDAGELGNIDLTNVAIYGPATVASTPVAGATASPSDFAGIVPTELSISVDGEVYTLKNGSMTVVPEPASYAGLLALGVLGWAGFATAVRAKNFTNNCAKSALLSGTDFYPGEKVTRCASAPSRHMQWGEERVVNEAWLALREPL